MRPSLVVEITGTGTEVGKTFTAARLLRGLAGQGLSVEVRKPVQSYSPGDTTDSEILARETGEPAQVVCPARRSYPLPMAPPMAAEALGRTPSGIDDLVTEIAASWSNQRSDVGLVEGAGGLASPLAPDGDNATLAFRLPVDVVVLVTEPGLGVINLVRLCCRALELVPTIVHLNRLDPANTLHLRNLDWLVNREALTVTTSHEDLLDEILTVLSEKTDRSRLSRLSQRRPEKSAGRLL